MYICQVKWLDFFSPHSPPQLFVSVCVALFHVSYVTTSTSREEWICRRSLETLEPLEEWKEVDSSVWTASQRGKFFSHFFSLTTSSLSEWVTWHLYTWHLGHLKQWPPLYEVAARGNLRHLRWMLLHSQVKAKYFVALRWPESSLETSVLTGPLHPLPGSFSYFFSGDQLPSCWRTFSSLALRVSPYVLWARGTFPRSESFCSQLPIISSSNIHRRKRNSEMKTFFQPFYILSTLWMQDASVIIISVNVYCLRCLHLTWT